jgi:hypothetical protein
MLTVLTIAQPGAIGTKILVLLMIFVIYGVGYFIWDIYTARPLKALVEYGHQIDSIAAQRSPLNDPTPIFS